MLHDPDIVRAGETLAYKHAERTTAGGRDLRFEVGERDFPPPCFADLEVLVGRGFNNVLANRLVSDSRETKVPVGRLLLDRQLVSQDAYYSAVAEICGLPFLPGGSFNLSASSTFPKVTDGFDHEAGAHLWVLGKTWDGRDVVVVAPKPETLPLFQAFFERFPYMRERVRVASPAAILSAGAESDPGLRLALRKPEASSKFRLTQQQAWFFGFSAVIGVGGLALPMPLLALLASLIAVSCSSALGVVRIVSAFAAGVSVRPRRFLSDHELPFYSVLVPLHREVKVVPDLVRAMERLDYPQSKREVLFLLEQDDAATLATLQPRLGPSMRIVIVPEGRPRTKPRALVHGLGQARGELVTIFDGEDRPDPLQLRTAASAFAELPGDVAALQAHLAVDHVDRRFFVRQFSLEYAGLFDCLMPWLCARGLPIPLGGTSNHFRREALEKVEGWDPYNVTEDADLGIRLVRHGYRLLMLDSATLEEAPVNWDIWHSQRTRWLKGWLQTLLVSLRDPPLLAREIGRPGVMAMLVYFSCIVLTLALHPLFVLMVALNVAGVTASPFSDTAPGYWIIVLASGGMAASYLGTACSMAAGAARRGILLRSFDLLLIPLYWLLQSFAFYAAVIELVVWPHHWRKTPHGLAKRPPA